MIESLCQDITFYLFDKLEFSDLLKIRQVSNMFKENIYQYILHKSKTYFGKEYEMVDFIHLYNNFYDFETDELNKFIRNVKSTYNMYVIDKLLDKIEIDEDFFFSLISLIKKKEYNLLDRIKIVCTDISYLNYKKKIIKHIIDKDIKKKLYISDSSYFNLPELAAIYGDFVLLKYFFEELNLRTDPNFYQDWNSQFNNLNSYELVYYHQTNELKSNYDIIESMLLNKI